MASAQSTSDIGKWAEEIAVTYLMDKGYQIIHTNWRAQRGDIDIIAIDNNYLVFIEVKGGSSAIYGPPELRITANKKRQLYKLASLYLAEHEDSYPDIENHRFDVIVVDGSEQKYAVRHYENAFIL
jgi:putative endonuclease